MLFLPASLLLLKKSDSILCLFQHLPHHLILQLHPIITLYNTCSSRKITYGKGKYFHSGRNLLLHKAFPSIFQTNVTTNLGHFLIECQSGFACQGLQVHTTNPSDTHSIEDDGTVQVCLWCAQIASREVSWPRFHL